MTRPFATAPALDRAPEARSLEPRGDDHPPRAESQRAELQLSATRGKLGLELAHPVRVGPLRISQLVWLLEGLRFPLDLSGGVSRFRHRRGSLDSLCIEANPTQLARHVLADVRRAFDNPHLSLSLLVDDAGFTVGLADETSALAFSLWFAPVDATLRWVVTNARGLDVGYHTHAAALRAAQAILGRRAKRRGSVFSIDGWIGDLIREILVDAGARLPRSSDVRLAWNTGRDTVELLASSQISGDAPSADVQRAMHLASICEAADDALLQDQTEKAREAYCLALQNAPRHPDIALRIAELDALADAYPQAALATIVEAMPAMDAGIVAAFLLQKLGDQEGARVALRQAAAREPFAPLGARILARTAELTPCGPVRDSLLDEAVALCPSSATLRRQRARQRLAMGRTDDALADMQHLEAAAQGSEKRFDACLQAGQWLLDAGLASHARTYFDRALRYCPRSPHASSGLARAYLATGDGRRAVELLSRAESLAEQTGNSDPDLTLELAKAMAEHLGDLPSAIFQVHKVPFGIAQTIEARALEAKWRGELGDLVGASHAYAQTRHAALHLPLATVAGKAAWLMQAARFELEQRRDLAQAKTHAELALRAVPTSTEALALFQKIAASQARLADNSAQPVDAPREGPHLAPPDAQTPDIATDDLPHAPPQQSQAPDQQQAVEDPSHVDSESFDAAIERLTEKVRVNPQDDQAVSELCELLEKCQRHLDLLALVSARMDEETDRKRRRHWTELRGRVLEHLIRQCYAEHRDDEAQMYETLLRQDQEER